MENQTEVASTIATTSASKRRVQAARQKLRMCVAAERVFARLGTRAIVADVLKEAGMSRRSFYEHFKDRDDLFESMQRATVNLALSWGQRGRPVFVPCAPWMVLALNPLAEGVHYEDAFDRAREIARGAAHGVPHYQFTDAEVLEWAAATLEVSK